MAVGSLAPHSRVRTLFPASAVEKSLRAELMQAVKDEAAIKAITLPTSDGDIAKAAFQVDSLIVVSLLCAVEPIVGFELTEKVVRTGGYGSVDRALYQLLPRIEAEWKKRNGGIP